MKTGTLGEFHYAKSTPFQLVWQEAEVGMLDTSRNLHRLKSVAWKGFGV